MLTLSSKFLLSFGRGSTLPSTMRIETTMAPCFSWLGMSQIHLAIVQDHYPMLVGSVAYLSAVDILTLIVDESLPSHLHCPPKSVPYIIIKLLLQPYAPMGLQKQSFDLLRILLTWPVQFVWHGQTINV